MKICRLGSASSDLDWKHIGTWEDLWLTLNYNYISPFYQASARHMCLSLCIEDQRTMSLSGRWSGIPGQTNLSLSIWPRSYRQTYNFVGHFRTPNQKETCMYFHTFTSQLNSISASIVLTLTLKVFGCFFFRPKIDIVTLYTPEKINNY